MKNSKTLFWSLITIGTLGVFASLFSFSQGQDFNSYFWGGFCGVSLIGTTLIQQKEENIKANTKV
jgi:hypothetical protein